MLPRNIALRVTAVIMVSNGKSKRKDEITCVQLSRNTKSKLDTFGKKSDTYETIIKHLIDSQCVQPSQDEEEIES